MASHTTTAVSDDKLDLSRWKKVPTYAVIAGVAFLILGAVVEGRHGSEALMKGFGFSWLTGFMFFLSLCMGGLFLTLAHHLFDASWSVPIRRYCEHLACLALPLSFLFLPILFLAKKMYPWMTMGTPDHALHAKHALLNTDTLFSWYTRAPLYFIIWIALAFLLRKYSVAQDKDGAAHWTFKMRLTSYIGIFLFAISLTFAAIDWMKSLQHQWYSTMYGVWYFAGSVWTTIATVYCIAVVLKRAGPLKDVLFPTHFYYIGSLLLAFTVFFAYITFSQYFIQWNANMPEEIFWYKLREQGTWWWVGMVVIFGHFFVPFLTLLRIDFKLKLVVMFPVAIWAWLMHYTDMCYNILPTPRPDNFYLHWMDIGAFLLIGGVLATLYIRSLGTTAAYPLRDPRLKESLTSHELPASEAPASH
jgi:hypothetical protein